MRCSQARPRVPRVAASALLALGLACVILATTQCRRVDDAVTGVDVSVNAGAGKHASCMHQCGATFRLGLLAEQTRHRRALRNCRWSTACQVAERATHRKHFGALVQRLENCRHSCYNEGGGEGGR